MTKTTWTHVCKHQRGRWPIDNELVLCHPEGGEPQTLRIVETSPIHTAPKLSGKPDYVFCRCEPDKNTWDTFSDRQQDYLYENKLFVDLLEESDDDSPQNLMRIAKLNGVVIGEIRMNDDGTYEICGVDGQDETVADGPAARKWIQEAAECELCDE